MTGKEIARNYKIPQTKHIGSRTYYLEDVYKYKVDAVKRANDLRSMKYPVRIIKIKKPGTGTYHTALYRSTH